MNASAPHPHFLPPASGGADAPSRVDGVAGSGRKTPGECVHCGLPLGAHHREEDGPFCCNGCRAVYELIHEEGLDRYYELKNCRIAPPAELRPNTMTWLDPILEEAMVLPGGSVRRLRLDVQGIHCAACVWLLEQIFRRHRAGKHLRINPALGTVEILWDIAEEDLKDYLREVERFGYRFGPARKETPRRSRDLLIRMGISISLALNVMMYSLSYYFGLAPRDGSLYRLFGNISFALATIALVVGGWPFMRGAWQGLRRRVAHLDLPIALGMVLAWAGSTYAWLTSGPKAAYFDTITIFIALMLVGRWMQERVLEKNRNALLASGGIADLYARRFGPKGLLTVSASTLKAGDTIWVAPGDLVPVEGILLHHEALVSLDWITGEADPRRSQPGDTIPAGAFNAGPRGFRLTAREDFSASRLNELVSENPSEDDSASPPRDRWHRVATIYVIAVLGLAGVGFALWMGHGLRRAVEVSVAVLVVTCPCALGLALPLGRELAYAALRRRGILLRKDDFLDRALRVRRIVFDKTGTLTRGQLRLTGASRRALLALPENEKAILREMTSRSLHPVSRCLAAALKLKAVAPEEEGEGLCLAPSAVDSVVEEAGEGLRWADGEHEYRLGRPSFAVEGPALEALERDARARLRAVFARDGAQLAAFSFEEEIRPDAREEVRRLRAQGLEVHIYSGDGAEKVQAVAESIGIDPALAHGDMTPEMKARALRSEAGRDALMVGDGLNDSLGFDAALCSATPAVDRAVLPEKADFYFLGDGIGAVRRALKTAVRLRHVQRDNLIFAVLYNGLAVTLCLMGLVSPVVAAILMPLSSVSVVALTTTRMARREAAWMS